MRRAATLPILIAALLPAWSQEPAPAFEAASIKPNNSGRAGGGINIAGARIHVINSTVKFCVQMAWNVMDFQVSGASGWMDTDRFDIDAVATAPFKNGEYRAMLQTLLASRFGLVIHHDTQEKPGFALIAARGGPKLPPPTESMDTFFSRTPSGDMTLKATNASMQQFAGLLSSNLRAIVVDRTAIEGRYDVSLQWTPDPTTLPLVDKAGMPLPQPPPDAAAGPSIFAALQEKLGLKLEARKVPVEVIVIDQAHRPTEN